MPDAVRTHRRPFTAESCDLDEFRSTVEQPTDISAYHYAAATELGAVVYECATLESALADSTQRRELLDEVADALLDGPGIIVLRGAVPPDAIAPVNAAFFDEITEQRAAGVQSGDHYAKPGANDRVWNAIEKLAVRAPEAFVDYYANDFIALAAEAWLGPDYQISSQVNVVNPGGLAQSPHRDYHVGFMTDEQAERYPRHAHLMSGTLTLQGAIAHCDMPVETGPTLYLPHSQKYDRGFLAWRRPEFIDYFEQHHVQVPLQTGDAVFFNPALFHAAGTNTTADVRRIANLLQISSAMGRAMETIDTRRMTLAVYDVLARKVRSGMGGRALENVIVACSEGYAFPTNLDRDPPLGGLTPPSQADVLRRALTAQWDPSTLQSELDAHRRKRLTHDM